MIVRSAGNACTARNLAMEFGGELSASDIAKCSLAQQLDRLFTNECARKVRIGKGRHWEAEVDHRLDDALFDPCRACNNELDVPHGNNGVGT